MERISERLVRDVKKGKALFGTGFGHSALVPMELFHRAGGPVFFIPLLLNEILPLSGPNVVRIFERSPDFAEVLLSRFQPKKGEMIWIFSQSGINSIAVEMALLARQRGLYVVGFTSLKHSQATASRHKSGKKLYQICDAVVDLGGKIGDAALEIQPGALDDVRLPSVGPLSSLSGIFLAHSILSVVSCRLEQGGIRSVYTSVNTPEGEERNRELQRKAAQRDPRLR